jgi:hypothetical protein
MIFLPTITIVITNQLHKSNLRAGEGKETLLAQVGVEKSILLTIYFNCPIRQLLAYIPFFAEPFARGEEETWIREGLN